MKKKTLLISEALSAPFDEGVKNFVYSLHKQFEIKKDVLSVTKAGNKTENLKVKKINLNKLFLNNELRLLLRSYAPYFIIYVPYSSCSFYSFFRAKMLKLMSKEARVMMLGVQHRKFPFVQRIIIKNMLKPDSLFVIGKSHEDDFLSKVMKVRMLPPAVDNAKFRPATLNEKTKIRSEYRIPTNKKIILHVGHIKKNRNIECFFDVQKRDDLQVVIVGSTSTEKDEGLKARIVKTGIRVIDDFIPDISKIYKMSDIYVFPVLYEYGAIDMPLSVLEALACNLPVITTRFSGLVEYFNECSDFRYFSTSEELIELIKQMDNVKIDNSKKVESYTWKRCTDEIISECEKLV